MNLFKLTCFAVLWAAGAGGACAQPAKPNVVFILADNVGYGDLVPMAAGAARSADAAHRPARARRASADAVSGRARLHPSRAALMTGQYSIRNGLSLILVPGSDSTLSQRAVTMGELFKGGLCHGDLRQMAPRADPQSLPTAHGFDEFYGIPPEISWTRPHMSTRSS